jgi:hypothetical protein
MLWLKLQMVRNFDGQNFAKSVKQKKKILNLELFLN